MNQTNFLDVASLVLGAILIYRGFKAIAQKEAHVLPDDHQGEKAVYLGCLWAGLGLLFIASVLFDISALKMLFRLFLESAN